MISPPRGPQSHRCRSWLFISLSGTNFGIAPLECHKYKRVVVLCIGCMGFGFQRYPGVPIECVKINREVRVTLDVSGDLGEIQSIGPRQRLVKKLGPADNE